jgi:hypothetical protein
MNAGIHPRSQDSVGVWIARRTTSQRVDTEIAVDLLVPASVSPGSGRRAARIVRGLDGAIVDADVMTLDALDENDPRAIDVRVAGPAALLIAKAHKINERQGTNRLSDKDALDVLRLLQGTETAELATRFSQFFADQRSAAAAKTGRDLLATLFARRASVGIAMAIRSAGALADADEIAASCAALVSDLLAALK